MYVFLYYKLESRNILMLSSLPVESMGEKSKVHTCFCFSSLSKFATPLTDLVLVHQTI